MKYLIILALLLTNCATTESAGKAVGHTAVTCGEEAMKNAASQLVPAFLGILSADITNWKDQAKVLGKEFGKDVATCAARIALAKIVAPVQSEANPQDPETVKRTATARLRSLELEE